MPHRYKMIHPLTSLYYYCTSPKLIATVALSGMVLAQEIPPTMDWAKLPIEVACVGALFWVTTRTMPSLFEKQITAQKEQQEKYHSSLDNVLKTQEAAFDKLTTAITARVDHQAELTQRLLEGKH